MIPALSYTGQSMALIAVLRHVRYPRYLYAKATTKILPMNLRNLMGGEVEHALITIEKERKILMAQRYRYASKHQNCVKLARFMGASSK